MDNLPLLEIEISAQSEITLRFHDPATGVQPNVYRGQLVLPDDLLHPEDDPIAHGRGLSNALLASTQVRDEFLAALNATVHATPSRSLRISLGLPAELESLHDLAWETLLDPSDDQPLLSRSRVYFFRFLQGQQTIGSPPDGPRALVFIANPERLAVEEIRTGEVRLQPVDVNGELRRARQGLRPLVPEAITSVPGQKGAASLDRLLSELSDPNTEPYHILYLVCHGQTSANNKSRLWLDQEEDDQPVDAQRLVDGLRDLDAERRPRLVVLASCQSAGQPGTGNEASVDRGALAAIGPKLVQQAGIAAVVAMQGDVFMRSVEAAMPAFFVELVHSGQVERAMAVARSRLRIQTDPLIREQWRVPVLFSRLADGQIWPPRKLSPRTVYLCHADEPADAQAEALAAARELLDAAGFEVVESPGRPETAEPWSRRLLEGLGTCDAAVLLLDEQTLAEADNWVQTEARILCWRQWLEPGFRLVPLCLGADCLPRLQEAPWTLLCEAGAPALTWTTPDDLEAQLRELLEPLLRDVEPQQRWRLSDLQRRVIGHFKEMELDDVLLDTAQKLEAEYGLQVLPEEQNEPARWWARATLSRGPVVLSRLYDELGDLVTPRVKEAVKGLLGPVQPAWVDIAAAAQIVHLAAHADRAPGSFYLKGLEPFDWIAQSYAARACGRDYDRFMEQPCLLLVVPPTKSDNDTQRLSQIRTTLRERLERIEPDQWLQAWSEAGGAQPDDFEMLFFGPADLPAGDDGRVDEAIKRCVEERAARGRPVLLVLSGASATRHQLFADVRQRFGPVCFFYMGKDPAPAAASNGVGLASDLPIEVAGRAYQEWKRLYGFVSS